MGVQESQNSVFNQAMYGSQFGAGQETSLFDNQPFDSTGPSTIASTPMNTNRTAKMMAFNSPSGTPTGANGSLNAYLIGNNTPQMSSSPQQTLLNANILKAPNATSIDQAFNVLCNLDALSSPPIQQPNHHNLVNGNGIANGNGSPYKEDPFAQMRPPPKKSINELRGSPPTSSSPSAAANVTPLSALDELYSSSPKTQAISPAFGGGATLGFTSSSAPPIPPRTAPSNGLLPPPPTPTENPSRHNRRPLPQPINNANGLNVVGNGGLFDNHKSHDPFADDPFFTS